MAVGTQESCMACSNEEKRAGFKGKNGCALGFYLAATEGSV